MPEVYGKKVFILYPQSVIQEEMLHLLIASEYEVALLRDIQQTTRVLAKYPDSIIFVNIEAAMEESQWETFIRSIMDSERTKSTRIGILAYNADPNLTKKYLMDIGVQCGYITLKLGLKETFRIMVKALEANEAKGRRRFVRAICKPQDKASFNVKYSGDFQTGTILDISSAGMACTFDKPPNLRRGTHLVDIQLKLRAMLCRVSGELVGTDKEKPERVLVLFSKDISPRERHKIHQFVYDRLQETIDTI